MCAQRAVEEILAAKPAWIDRGVKSWEARLVALEIARANAKTALEIGVASGFTSAVIFSALAENTTAPQLYGIDLAERCYFDTARPTGEAFHEIHGETQGFHLETGVSSADMSKIPVPVDFVLIDANHRAPWPALDLLSVARFLAPNATIALHDLELLFGGKWKDMSGPRDLYRTWRGEKWTYNGFPNLGFLKNIDHITLANNILASLCMSWDKEIDDLTLGKYVEIADELFGAKTSEEIANAFTAWSRSAAPARALPDNSALRAGLPANALRSFVFIVSYGRTGSTLLQKIIGSIDGFHIAGENYNALYDLYRSYESVRLTKKRFGNRALPKDDPWFGAEELDSKSYGRSLMRLFINQVLKPPEAARVIGFKEIRYFKYESDFAPMLKFILRFFNPAKIVFSVRSADTIHHSAWWNKLATSEVDERIARYTASIDDFIREYPDQCLKISREKLTDNQTLQELFDFLGEPYHQAQVLEMVAIPLKHARGGNKP